MRPGEVLLCLANLLAFAALVAPPARPWARAFAFLALAAAAGQAAFEGTRWQMTPAYALSLALLLAASPKRAWRTPGGWIAASFAILALALSAALPLALPVFRFPPPRGPYGVGTATYHWTDPARLEAFTADPADRRELMVQVWYPAPRSAEGPRAPYVEDGAALAPLARLLGLPGFVLGHLRYVRTNAVALAPAAPGRFPVLVFAHGRGGYRQHNTLQVEALVSRGYVVATLDQPYAAAGVVFPDGRRVEIDPRLQDPGFKQRAIAILAGDVPFALDRLAELDRSDPHERLAGRLDLARAGAFGVSLGGAVVAEACRRDARLRACLMIDVFMPAAVVRDGLSQPAMWITRDAATMRREGWRPTDVDEHQETMRAAFDHMHADGYFVRIPGAYHASFADAPLFAAPPLARALGLSGPADAGRVHAAANDLSLAFFDRHLKGAAAPLLDDPARAYPELMFEARRPVPARFMPR